MGYLDELRSLFEQAGDPDDTDPDGTVLATDVEVLDDGPLGMARSQLEGARTGYHEGPEGTFRACGSRYGCGCNRVYDAFFGADFFYSDFIIVSVDGYYKFTHDFISL